MSKMPTAEILRQEGDPILAAELEVYDYEGEAYILAADQIFIRSHPLNSNAATDLALDLLRSSAGEYEGAAVGAGALQGIGDALALGLDMVQAHDDIDVPDSLVERLKESLAKIHSELSFIRAVTTTTLES